MKKVEIKGQNDEQLQQLILKNQKDIVAEKIAIFTQQTTKNHVIKTKKKRNSNCKNNIKF
jgi:ribosomal protein L29